jgi:hypothetical protein
MRGLKFLIPVLLILIGQSLGHAQPNPSFSVVKIQPFDKAVPGQIFELQVDGLSGAAQVKLLPPEDFQVEVIQDGVKQSARVRMILPTASRTFKDDGSTAEMKRFQNVTFVVPHGLHPGPAQAVLSYKGETTNPISFTIVARPLRPVIGGPAIITTSPLSLPAPAPGTRVTDLGWRFERDSKIQLHLKPLVDPDDPASAILIRFRQGNEYYDAPARVVHESERTERSSRGVAFLPPREYLQVEVPAALQMGPADVEIKVRANGAESDPIVLKVQITDTTRSAEAPVLNAPRLLNVNPQRVGAGQALMLSVDYLRTLNPDPAQTLVSIEHENARYLLKPESNSALRMPNKAADAPVLIIVRVSSEIIGPAQVRVMNSLKGEGGGTSAPVSIEVVNETLPPEITSVAESTESDLARLRETYEIQRAAGKPFKAFDPASRYLTIKARGLDPNPRFVRIAIDQNGQTANLGLADVSSASPDLYIVRLPATATPGTVKVSISNVGAQGLSASVSMTFDLSH